MKTNLTKEDKDKVGLYLLYNSSTHQAYVGSGVLNERQYEHERALLKNIHCNYKLQKAFNKDPNFEFIGVPVEDFNSSKENRELALHLEQSIIDEQFENPLFLNIARSTQKPTFGIGLSAESIAKRTEKRLGTKHTEETKIKISKASSELWSNPDRRKERSDQIKEQYNSGKRIAPWADKKIPIDVVKEMSKSRMKKVSVNDVVYESVREAAVNFRIAPNTASQRINSESFPDWKFI